MLHTRTLSPRLCRWSTFALLLLLAGSLSAQIVIYSDPLKGSTKGQLSGNGTFTATGWKSEGGRIVYNLGSAWSEGSFECNLSDYTAQTAGCEKSHPVSGYACLNDWGRGCGAFFQLRIGHYDPFKVLTRFEGADRHEARAGKGNGTGKLQVTWTLHTLKITLNGQSLADVKKTGNNFFLKCIIIGVDGEYGVCGKPPTFSDVKITVINRYQVPSASQPLVQNAPNNKERLSLVRTPGGFQCQVSTVGAFSMGMFGTNGQLIRSVTGSGSQRVPIASSFRGVGLIRLSTPNGVELLRIPGVR